MYTIDIYSAPYYALSGNPCLYKIKINGWKNANIQDGIKLKIDIQIVVNGQSQTINTQYLYPDAQGFATINVAKYIDAQLQYYRPTAHNVFQIAKNQSIRHNILCTIVQDGEKLSNEIDSDFCNAYKGGIQLTELTPTSFYDKFINAKKPLNFVNSNHKIFQNQPLWLWFIARASNVTNLKLVVQFLHINTSTGVAGYTADIDILDQFISVNRSQIICIPIHIASLSPNTHIPAGTVLTGVNIKVTDGTNVLIPYVNYSIDYNTVETPNYISFRNSLGAIDSTSIGMHTTESISQKLETYTIKSAFEYFGLDAMNQTLRKSVEYFNNIQFNTPYLRTDTMKQLVDVLLQHEAPIWHNGSAQIPLFIDTEKTVITDNRQGLYSLALSAQYAHADAYSTPAFNAIAPTCPAVEYFGVTTQKSKKAHISWKLPTGYDKAKVVYTASPGYTTPITIYLNGNAGELDLPVFATGVTNLFVNFAGTVQVVCCDATPASTSLGPITNFSAPIQSSIAPIAIPNTFGQTYRGLGTRFLFFNTLTEFDILANDIDNSGLAIVFDNFYDATNTITTTTANGADIAVTSLFPVTYSGTAASIANTAEDFVFYRCKQWTGSTWIYSNYAKLTIPVAASIPKVYVKLVYLDSQEVSYKFGLFNFYASYSATCNVMAIFYKDSGKTIPIDVTNFGLQISLLITNFRTQYSNIGNSTSLGNTTNTQGLFTANGYSQLLLPNYDIVEWDANNDIQTTKTITKDAAGSVGDWEIVY
jgi:hypothetical protein